MVPSDAMGFEGGWKSRRAHSPPPESNVKSVEGKTATTQRQYPQDRASFQLEQLCKGILREKCVNRRDSHLENHEFKGSLEVHAFLSLPQIDSSLSLLSVPMSPVCSCPLNTNVDLCVFLHNHLQCAWLREAALRHLLSYFTERRLYPIIFNIVSKPRLP